MKKRVCCPPFLVTLERENNVFTVGRLYSVNHGLFLTFSATHESVFPCGLVSLTKIKYSFPMTLGGVL